MSTWRNSRGIAVALVTLATFTDIVAYSVAIPVLPDLSRKLGASPTMIGLLFASFGVTLLTVSIPMGAVSDRIGRKAPMVSGLVALGAATLLFAFADSLPWLFAARLVQGAADAVTWVVGFALIADLYDADERGRVTGIVMMGTSLAVMVGPTFGGWLYELGGIRMPFIGVAGLAALATVLFAGLEVPAHQAPREPVPIGIVLRAPAIATCAIVVIGISATISMLEPVLALHLAGLGVTPARLGLIYGAAAVGNTMLNPITGRISDRWGSRRTMMLGLLMMAGMIAVLGQARSYASALVLFVIAAATGTFVITPSLAFMGEATTGAGVRSFGVSYGLYNLAWGVGLLGGPALGGFLFERLGFAWLLLVWAPMLLLVRSRLARVESQRHEINTHAADAGVDRRVERTGQESSP
jgi:MFS transporter, DHA1 family, solute carrier family 18 (vesicular amine transporter), member 1/2